MPKLPGISQRTAIRALEKAGFEIIREGKHTVLSDGVKLVMIPRHNPINAFTMGKIAQDAGFSVEEFKRLI